MLGDLDSSDTIAWGFAQETGALVVSVDYRLTPDHPYPAAVEDCWAALLWMRNQADHLGIDARRIAVAGDSAGGNLGAVMALKARDTGEVHLTGVAIIYPGTGLDQDQPSYLEHADGPGLTRASTLKYRDLYLPGDRETQGSVCPTNLGGRPLGPGSFLGSQRGNRSHPGRWAQLRGKDRPGRW